MILPRKDRIVPLRMSVGRKPLLVTLIAGLAAVPALPDTPPMLLTLGLDQRFSIARNEPLRVPSEGQRTLSTTGLSLRFISETASDRLRFDTSTQFRIGDRDGASVSEFEEPRLRLSYAREGADSDFTIDGSFRRSRVEFARSTADFINEEGELELPEDFEDSGRGQRTDYSASARLVMGRSAAPIGVTLEASASGIDYSDDDGTLDDRRRSSLGATFRLRLNPVVNARLNLRHSRLAVDDDPVNPTRRRTDSMQAGIVYDVSPTTQLDAGLGWTRIDRRDEGIVTEGLNARFDLGADLPDGSIGIGLTVDQTIDGERSSLVARRSLELPEGRLSARLGATRLPVSGDVGFIGGLDWTRTLPNGRVGLRLDRSVIGDDERRYRTTLSGSYSHDINPVSSVSLRFDHVNSSATSDRNEVQQTSLRANYSHRLTPDWSLNTGVSYRVRREDTVGRATSPGIFLGLGRQFEFPL